MREDAGRANLGSGSASSGAPEPRREGPAVAAPGRAEGSLEFPVVARLALDELLDEFLARSGEVKATQGRLRGLLAATHHLAAALDLDELLQRIVESARTLTGARAAALGVLGDGKLNKLVHAGMSPKQATAITELPVGAGVLGHLLTHPEPLRLKDLSAPAAAGSFAQHPPGTSFLGTQITVGGEVFGVLHLTDPDQDCFSAADEELVVALAAAAGLSIQNALLYDEARRRERWQAVSTQITRHLLSDGVTTAETRGRRSSDEVPDALDDGPGDQWQRLLDLAMRTAQAQGGAVCAVDPIEQDTVEVVATVGMLDGWAHQRVNRAGSLTEAVLNAEGPVTFDDTRHDPRTAAAAERVAEMHRAVGIRLTAAQGQRPTVMMLTRANGQPRSAPWNAT